MHNFKSERTPMMIKFDRLRRHKVHNRYNSAVYRLPEVKYLLNSADIRAENGMLQRGKTIRKLNQSQRRHKIAICIA